MKTVGICLVLAVMGSLIAPGSSWTAEVSSSQSIGDSLQATSRDTADASVSKSDPSIALDVTAASKYLFQGIDYSEGKGVVQPNMVASFAGFSAVAWGNYQPDLNVVNEIDLSLKYAGTARRLSITPGYTYLAYPNRDWDPSQELFVDFGLEAPLSPALSLHYDFDAGKGLYATLAMSHEIIAPVSIATNVFYQNQYYEMTGFPATELKLSASWAVGTMSISPQISHFFTWDNRDFRGELAIPSTWLFSVNASVPVSF